MMETMFVVLNIYSQVRTAYRYFNKTKITYSLHKEPTKRIKKMKGKVVPVYQFLGGDGGRTQDQWGKTEFLFKGNLSVLRNHRDWIALVPLNFLSSSKYILYNMRTPAFASAPSKCYQTHKKAWWQSKKNSKRPKDIALFLVPLGTVNDFTWVL